MNKKESKIVKGIQIVVKDVQGYGAEWQIRKMKEEDFYLLINLVEMIVGQKKKKRLINKLREVEALHDDQL